MLELQLAVDASPVGLGAVISPITSDGTEHIQRRATQLSAYR